MRSSLTKPRHVGENLIGGLRPNEGTRRLVGDGEVVSNGRFERAHAAVGAPLDLFLGQQSEPPFDEIQPRGTGRREVEVEPRVTRQPATHPRGFVRAVVVEDQVHVQVGRDGAVNRLEELEKLLTPMPPMALADDLAVATSSAANNDVVPCRR